MGLAVIVPDISFAGSNIGQVTPISPTPLTALAIDGPSAIVTPETTGQYSVIYTPSDTSEKGVSWSVVEGAGIASIDSNGLLSVSGTGTIKIRATSSIRPSIYAEKTIITQAYTPLEDLTDRLNFPQSGGYYVTGITLAEGDYVKLKFARLSNNSIGFFVGSRQLANADDDTSSVEINTAGKVLVKLFGTKWEAQNAVTLNTRYTIVAKQSGVTCSPSLGTFTQGAYAYTQGYPLCIDGILYANNNVGYNGGTGDIFGIEIYGADDTLKHRLIPQSDLTWLDEVTNQSYSKTGGDTVNFGTD